ncbi:MAG: isoleucine--tRNA ligase [Candidatus Omnitrophica bacterium]|nr:isoleucine--tRNA ligase [Candidatus Omnitrophota bacterium]
MEKVYDYKSTINLPETDFSMKADLPKKEPLLLEEWQKRDIYKKILEKTKNAPRYILHDGPPYANGHIHIGHALNKILKDVIVKYKMMQGFYSPYIPGWDCHGLPVELQLFKELKKRKEEVEQVEFRRKAHDFAMKFVKIQKEEFKRLGVFGNWEEPYLTLSHKYEAEIIRAFAALSDKGYIYKGTKPVNWCCNCETALAEAEVEYEMHNVFIVIWTTTPWTLLGNVACAVHPDFTYVFVQVKDEILIIEQNLAPAVLGKAGISEYTVIHKVRGVDLEHVGYTHPLKLRQGKVVLADYVSCEDGSGVVHTAPGYGGEDFLTGKRYNLEILMQVDNKGVFFENTPEVGKMHVFKASKKIIEMLKDCGALLNQQAIEHSYPHCWRCKEPIIFRATEQWFMSIDHNSLRKKILNTVKNITWIPQIGENRISSMIETRPDWCLSRQRLWGVPIPVFYCAACNKPVLDKNIIEKFAKIVENEGTDSWFIKEADELLPKGYVCTDCKKSKFVKENDILDVWFDSGVSHQAVIKLNPKLGFPADLYLEGSDQHRGWFQSALITSMAIDECAPFKEVLTHGFTVDGEGRKMSKSRGNVIAPLQVIERLGADVLRLCIASSDYNDDVRMSEEILARVSESYRKIRNTFKFILGNLSGFDPKKDMLEYEHLLEIDRWAISSLHSLIKQVTQAYDNFMFYQAIKLVYNFCIVQMSSFYLDVLKDRLYTFSKSSLERRSAQTVLFEILSVLMRLTAPVLSFTAEEAYGFSPGGKQESIFLEEWPKFEQKYINFELNNVWNFLLAVRNSVLKALEDARSAKLIGNSLEAKVVIFYNGSSELIKGVLDKYKNILSDIFIVSEVALEYAIDRDDLSVYNINFLKGLDLIEEAQIKIGVYKASGEKCVRCWKYSENIGENKQHPTLCRRCCDNLR